MKKKPLKSAGLADIRPKSNATATNSTSHTPRAKEIAIRFFTYGLMTLATIVGVVICVGWAMGYRFDLGSGQLSQVALLQFGSYPSGATVDVNGARVASTTPTRLNIRTGETTVKMSLQGYRSWNKTVSALPSSVRWLDYVRFVPNNVKTESIKTLPSVDQMIASPDKHWAIITTTKPNQAMVLVDVSDPEKLKFSDVRLSDSDAVTKGKNEEFHVDEWDAGSRYLLIKHSYDNQFEYLKYDRQDKSIQNLTNDFGIGIIKPHFSGNSGNTFYVLTDNGDLRKLDYSNKSISVPIASDVQSFELYDRDRIVMVQRQNKDDKITQTISLYDNNKLQTIKTYNDDKPTKLIFGRYNDIDYLAIGREETVAIYPDPLNSDDAHDQSGKNDQVAYLSSPGGIDWLGMSPNSRFVVGVKGDRVVVYDVETTEPYSYELKTFNGEISWLDNYHLLDVDNNEVSIMDFDGVNRQHIVSGHLPAFLSLDNKYMFSLDNISGGIVLQRSTMTTQK